MTLWETILESVKDKFNQISHTRIASYVILCTITINSLVFMGIEITNVIKSNGAYVIPMEHIAIFGMVLGHHLTLVGLKRNSETKQTKIDADASSNTSHTSSDTTIVIDDSSKK